MLLPTRVAYMTADAARRGSITGEERAEARKKDGLSIRCIGRAIMNETLHLLRNARRSAERRGMTCFCDRRGRINLSAA